MNSASYSDPYRPTDLPAYSWKERVAIRCAAWLATTALRALSLTLRLNKSNIDHLPDPLHGVFPAETPIIYAFWHNRILAATIFFQKRGIVVMTSQSRDGEVIARVIQNFGYGASRGSATRGGVQALKGLARALRAGRDAAFTIDGPKGPRYEAKLGAVMLARLSGAPIQPVCICVQKYWEVKSWDRFRIPRPFSRGKIFYGEPVYVSRDADETEMSAKQMQFQAELDRLRAESVAWTGRRE